MTTPKTDAIMALHDKAAEAYGNAAYVVAHVSDKQGDEMLAEARESRAALLAALQALDPPVEQPHLQFTAYHTDDTQAGTL